MEGIHQLVGNLSHCLQGFIHPRWCRISSSNSSHQIGRDFSSSQRNVSDVSEVWTDFVAIFEDDDAEDLQDSCRCRSEKERRHKKKCLDSSFVDRYRYYGTCICSMM